MNVFPGSSETTKSQPAVRPAAPSHLVWAADPSGNYTMNRVTSQAEVLDDSKTGGVSWHYENRVLSDSPGSTEM